MLALAGRPQFAGVREDAMQNETSTLWPFDGDGGKALARDG